MVFQNFRSPKNSWKSPKSAILGYFEPFCYSSYSRSTGGGFNYRGGVLILLQGVLCLHDFQMFLNWFLSDYVVPGCPKYIFGNFRNFLKYSEKNFSKFSPKALLMGPSKLSPMSKNHFCKGLRRPKIAHDPKNRFFQSPRYRYPNPTTEKETSN